MEGSFLFIDFDLPLVTLFKVGSTVGFSTLRHGRAVCINLCSVYLDVILVNDRLSRMDMNNMRRKKSSGTNTENFIPKRKTKDNVVSPLTEPLSVHSDTYTRAHLKQG